jgi:hypothetical protein
MQTSTKTPAFAFVALLSASTLAAVMVLAPTASAVCPDATNPIKITTLEWADLDRNGHLDAVRVATTRDLDKLTIFPSDFLIPAADDANRRALGVEPLNVAGLETTFWLTFRESGVLDAAWATGSPPSFSFDPPDGVVRLRAPSACAGFATLVPTKDEVNNASARTATDRASPLLMAGYAVAGATSVTAVFSEPASKDGGTTCSGTPPAGASCFLATGTAPSADFCLTNAAGASIPIYGVTATYPSQTFTLDLTKTVTGATVTASSDTITTSAAAFIAADVGRAIAGAGIPAGATISGFNSATSITISQLATATSSSVTLTISTALTSADMAVQNLASGSTSVAKLEFCGGGGTGFRDAAGNIGVVPSVPFLGARVAVGGPYPMRVRGSIGDTAVTVEFNGPVTNSAGTAITDAGSFAVGGSSPSWTIASAAQTLGGQGSNRVLLRSAAPLTVLTDGLVIQAASVKSTSGNAFSPGSITWPMADSVLSGPRVVSITSAETVSVNGCLDTVRVTFNEAVTSSGSVWNAFWQATGDLLVLTLASGDGTKTWTLTHAETPCQDTSAANTPRLSIVSGTPVDAAANPLVFGNQPSAGWTVGDASAAAAGATTLTSASGLFRADQVGLAIAPGGGIAPGTRITAFSAPSTVTITPATSGAVAGATVLAPRPVLYRDPSRDGAGPVVRTAATADCQVRQPSGPPLLTSAGCTPNGKLDGIVVTFSEPVAAFRHAGWKVEGDVSQPTACQTVVPAPATSATSPTYTVNGNASLTASQKLLRLSEVGGVSTFNTGCVPQVTYTGGSAPMTDDAGNALADLAASAAIETDGAGPVLTSLEGSVGSTYAQAVFSERPCGWRGAGCPSLQPSDFIYRATTGGSVQALAAVATTTPPSHLIDLTLASALTSADLANRCLEPVAPLNPGSDGSATTNGVSDGPGSRNPPFPRLGETPSCRTWLNTAAPRVVAAQTVDSNRDGFLDAVKLTLSQPIVAGSRILRVGGATPAASDTLYYDTDQSGGITAGDYRFTAYGTGGGCPANCPGDTVVAGGNADIGVALASAARIVWADLGAPGADGEDDLYADLDGNLNVTHADHRYLAQSLETPATVDCDAPRDTDCGRRLPATGYTDADRDGFVSDGDTRTANSATTSIGTVNCAAPDADCGRALTPTTFNLDAADFAVGFTPANTAPVVSCVLLGKGAGPVLGVAPSSCPNGVVGLASPPAGHKPLIADSCSGALAPAANNSVVYVCFTAWSSGTPLVPIPNTGQTPGIAYSASGTPPGGRIRGTTGLPLGSFNGANAIRTTDAAAPVLVEVLAGAGEKTLSVVFSEPVGKGSGNTQAPGPLDFAYVNGNAGSSNCQSGGDTIANVANPATAQAVVRVNLTRPLTHDDVVGCIQNEPPASAIPARDALRFVGTGFAQHGGGPALVTAPAPGAFTFRDRAVPTIADAAFLDASGDGILDAVRVTFSEPVNDCFGDVNPGAVPPVYPGHRAFCGAGGGADPTHRYGWATHADDFAVFFGTRRLEVRDIVTGQDGNAGSGDICRSTYAPPGAPLTLWPGETAPTFGPAADRHFNDNTIFLCLDPDRIAGDLSPGLFGGTRDLGTGITGTLTYTAPTGTTCATGRVCDLADVGPDAVSTMPAANLLASVTSTAPKAIADAARPVILRVETADRDHDGKVDAVKVIFSELVNPATWFTGDWDIEGRPIKGIDTEGNLATCPATATSSTGKPWVWLCVDEVAGASTFDTDIGRASTGPRLVYAAGGKLRDKALPVNNTARGFTGTVADGAEPAVVKVASTVDSATVTVTFSEGVDGTGGQSSLSITYSDMYFQDAGGSGSQASGFGANQVVHSPGDRNAVLLLNAPVSSRDFDSDKVCFIPGNVREHTPPTPFLTLYNTCVPLNGILVDTTPPSAVSDLRVNATATSASAVKLEWTAPNGTADADLAKYELRVCDCALSQANARSDATTAVTTGLPTPARGTRQTYTYTPPSGWDSLNFTLITLDNGDNHALSNFVRATPGDRVAPGVIASLEADGASRDGDRVTLTWTAPPQDAGAAASGRVAGYRIYRVQGSGPITQADLTSGNEVAASVTPGLPGSTQTAVTGGVVAGTTYTYVVLAYDAAGNMAPLAGSGQRTVTVVATGPADDKVPPETVSRRNAQITVNVTKATNGTGNIVTWRLPAEDPQHPTQGVQVWRCTGASSANCTTIADLPAGSAAFVARRYHDTQGKDGDRYLVTAYYGPTAEEGRAQSSADRAKIPGFGALNPKGTPPTGGAGIPLWVWILLGVALLLILVLVLWAVMRRKPGEEPPPTVAGEPLDEGWAAAEGGAEGAPQGAEGAAAAEAPPESEEHHVTCPKCSTEFVATGVKPLVIQCPSCGVKGTLR